MHLVKRYPNSIVAVFPSDHFVLQEDLFAAYLEQAFEIVGKCPAKIVFLGVEPTGPETEYGYILPEDADPDAASSVQGVKVFIEKPEPNIAAQLVALGALWNTMVMVFKPEILLHLVDLSAPTLHRSFQQIFLALGTPCESATVEKVYRYMEPMNFSKDLLGALDLYSRNQLSVVSMQGVFWSDWGSGNRIISALERLKCRAHHQRGPSQDDARDQPPTVVGVRLEASL
jgi:mannose-1-phosphate guanylyltransferase